ncbi:hypothetical protein C8F04DRAFT_386413 [Mycena alexandri]|uniref:Uncharacterized protein n=1 Tax=Mycena alexandri TaxID=1745969 RepID=A0AAD6T1A0_9AGAR|nr:hypothetical protein C8F04DRAFT_386413 [Mycena alexandri]
MADVIVGTATAKTSRPATDRRRLGPPVDRGPSLNVDADAASLGVPHTRRPPSSQYTPSSTSTPPPHPTPPIHTSISTRPPTTNQPTNHSPCIQCTTTTPGPRPRRQGQYIAYAYHPLASLYRTPYAFCLHPSRPRLVSGIVSLVALFCFPFFSSTLYPLPSTPYPPFCCTVSFSSPHVRPSTPHPPTYTYIHTKQSKNGVVVRRGGYSTTTFFYTIHTYYPISSFTKFKPARLFHLFFLTVYRPFCLLQNSHFSAPCVFLRIVLGSWDLYCSHCTTTFGIPHPI